VTSTSTATLLLLTTIVGGQGARLEVDAGLANGLRVGDRGEVYYELKVGPEARRVDVGEARVVQLDDLSAVVEHVGERDARPGYRVRFELPGGRISPAAVIRLAAERLDEAQFDELVLSVIADLLPVDPEIESRIRRLLEEREGGREAASPRGSAEPSPDEVTVPAGIFTIGLPLEKATFFNQQPRFDLELGEFRVGRRPVSQKEFLVFAPGREFDPAGPALPATAVAFAAAQDYCRAQGGRLPTEFEWEVAVREAGVDTVGGLLEWTSSWLQAYPGNTRPEAVYGERFKVLRGASSSQDPDLHLRRFLDPEKSHPKVGFRCAYSKDGAVD